MSARPVVLSVEQALSMSYATLRFVQLGWRVVRVEATPSGDRARGDPNRHIGPEVAPGDRHAYFVAPNVGKEAIALDLKSADGRALLRRLVRELRADVFCTNTMPARHRALGLDHASLSAERPELVWCCISAMGLAHPDVPGYDPALQALCGYMDLTGDPSGPPTQNGPPIIDLMAGDEAFAQVMHALWERAQTGKGRAIDVSMAHVAVSRLLTFLPMLDMGAQPEDIRRSGNEHRQFIPTNAYPTKDGWIYVAIGSDAQWQRLARAAPFATLARPELATNEGRRAAKPGLFREIGELTSRMTTAEVARVFADAQIPHAPITRIEDVFSLEALRGAWLGTTAPGGRRIRLPPAAVRTPWLDARGGELPFAPAYGEHTDAVLGEIGVPAAEIATLRARGVVA